MKRIPNCWAVEGDCHGCEKNAENGIQVSATRNGPLRGDAFAFGLLRPCARVFERVLARLISSTLLVAEPFHCQLFQARLDSGYVSGIPAVPLE